MGGLFTFIGHALGALAKLAPLAFAWLSGKRGAEVERLRDDAEARATAARVRDRLRRDPDYAQRVRDRFDR